MIVVDWGTQQGSGLSLTPSTPPQVQHLGKVFVATAFRKKRSPLVSKPEVDHATTVSIGRACSKRHAGPCSQYVSVSRPGSNLLPVILVPQYITKQSQRRPMLTESH